MTTLKDITPNFRTIRLLLAREKNHPEGASEIGYDIFAPIDADGHLIASEWKSHQGACRIRQFGQGGTERMGRLRRKPGGQWYFAYADGNHDEETGFRFGAERFVVGEYVSLMSGSVEHTYQVVRVERP